MVGNTHTHIHALAIHVCIFKLEEYGVDSKMTLQKYTLGLCEAHLEDVPQLQFWYQQIDSFDPGQD